MKNSKIILILLNRGNIELNNTSFLKLIYICFLTGNRYLM
jgi:hypothetical protein